jgi:hypothetical protein
MRPAAATSEVGRVKKSDGMLASTAGYGRFFVEMS